jgi:hypothetical protein
MRFKRKLSLRFIAFFISLGIFFILGTELTWAQDKIFHSYAKPIPAPDFALENLQREMVSLKDFREKVILLNFWATW